MLATLIRQLGDFELAEDALQDAFAVADRRLGRATACPTGPGAWITVTARRRAIDRLRRDRALADRVQRLRVPGRARGARSPTSPSRRRSPTTACA